MKQGALDLTTAKDWVRQRVSENRFQHISGVASTANLLAAHIGQSTGSQLPKVSRESIELAAWLHDACKEVPGSELLKLAKKFGVELDPVYEANPHLLHGPVAAQVCRAELGLKDKSILDAIAEHTLGAAPMSPLSQVIFLADILEPGRPTDVTGAVWKALRIENAPADFPAAIVTACDVTLQHLTQTKRVIHPRMVLVRNYYLAR